MIILRKKYKFCAAHRYNNKKWNAKKNVDIFGDDYKIHGHNYVLEIGLKGPIDKETGFLVNLNYINKLVNKNIIDVLDHSNIQDDIDWFIDKQPSSENLAIFIFEKLQKKIKKPTILYSVKIEETPTISSEYFGERCNND